MTPFHTDASLTMYVGDCRAVLAELEPESIQSVITSPPYFGLRDYGLPPATWGGDPDHAHVWEWYPLAAQSGGTAASTLGAASGGHAISPEGIERSQGRQAHSGGAAAFCACGAWRGQLGLEPSPAQYLDHLVEVLRAARRVLRRDGTLWLNLGDSYANDGKWGGHTGGKHVKALRDPPIGRNKRYTGHKPKDRMMIPARAAIALQEDGWWLRDEIVWHKPNPMPSSVEDRTTPAHEMVYLLTKSARYRYDAAAIRERAESGPSDLRKMAEGRDRIGGLVVASSDPLMAGSGRTNVGRKRAVGGAPLRERNVGGRDDGFTQMPGGEAEWAEDGRPGRNKRSVWTIATEPYPEAHFATFPTRLIEPMILAGTPLGGTVLDPFGGSGTVALVAERLGRRAVLIDLSPDYCRQAMERIGRARGNGEGPAIDMPIEPPSDSLWKTEATA